MARPTSDAARIIETWEISHPGTEWIWTWDKREDRYTKTRVGGRQGGSKKLHLSTDDRRFNEECIVDECQPHLNPFRNGSLRLISAEKAEDIDATYHLSHDDLAEMLEVRDSDTFNEAINDIKSELILRRLRDLAETQGTVAQLEALKELISSRYKRGGTQRTVREMIKAGEEVGGVVLSEM